MPSKDRVIKTINYSGKDREWIETMVKFSGLSYSELFRAFCKALYDGKVEIVDGGVLPLYDPYYETYKKLVGIMEDRGMEVGECLEGMIQRLQER